MTFEEYIRQGHVNNIKMIFIMASILLLLAVFQKFKPSFSLSYLSNSKPTYLKAKLLAKLISSATLYICGLYLTYFADLTNKTTMYSFWFLWIPILLYHVYKWGLTKFFDHKNQEE
ncbi:hypothetical protein [Desulfosporosinus nitroreducens]|uniref:Uncharacterized protein n=1 Tax=Desulfosporosinus nitroreducens TaxID=2018668 RepID=A0ABT8QWF1_9FIRM|nr:hypothetical protein [Desulfosporosinus nitroreducens]MDO0825668.1 hypothetical protein [Desulfosporosinus nitroreducens]